MAGYTFFEGGSIKMKKLHIIKYWYILLLVPIIIIAFFTVESLIKAKINTPSFQLKQSIMHDIDLYVKEHPNDGKDYRQEYFFYLNSNASLSLFYSAIKNSTPMNYEAYMARNQRDETTSESLVFILPCFKEQFSYYPKFLFCLEKKIVFQLNENDSKKLYEIITRLKSSK